MTKKIWAFVGFNIYALYLISAFQANTAYLLDSSLIDQLHISALDLSPRAWGWGDHYIWRLFVGVISTAIVGIFAGAIAKNNGAKIAAISNIPSLFVWGVMIYLIGFTNVEVEAKTGYIIISLIAIPLTTYVAYITGAYGEKLQKQEYSEDTILGIKGYHWIWAVFPLYWYSESVIFVAANFIRFQITSWANLSWIAALLSLLLLVPVLAWGYPVYLVYRVLRKDILKTSSSAIRSLANFGILVFGSLIAQGIQIGGYWLYNKIVS